MFWGFTSFSLFVADLKLHTQFSARPLMAGWYGADVKCLIWFLSRNIWNSSDWNCGPLPLTNLDGTPYWVNKFCSFSVVFVEVMVSIFSTLNRLQWASTTIKSMQPRMGLAKSIWIHCQGDDSHSHRCTGAVLVSACISWHPKQVFGVSSISLSIPGHQM